MAGCRRIALLFLAAAACTTLCGCLAVYTKKPIDVLVLDAETDEPIRGAEVSVGYIGVPPIYPFILNKPKDERRTTDLDGQAVVPVANFRWSSVDWDIRAPGYIEQTAMRTDGERVPPHFRLDAEETDGRRATIRLYREPLPSISVVVPDGYRGPLLLDWRPVRRWVQGQVGQREFVFCANERGYVGIDATPLLILIPDPASLFSDSPWPPPIRARYASGVEIPEHDSRIGDGDVSLRFITSMGEGGKTFRGIYVVGTDADEDLLTRHLIYVDGDPTRISRLRDAADRLFAEAAEGVDLATRNGNPLQ